MIFYHNIIQEKDMKVLLLFLITVLGFPALYTDVKVPRREGFSSWCTVILNESHVSWGANQPVDEWTRIFFRIPKGVTAIQVTPYDEYGIARKGLMSDIVEATAVYDVLYFAIQWWSGPFKLYVGWLSEAKIDCSHVILPGIPPY